jgi:hypothetical protein
MYLISGKSTGVTSNKALFCLASVWLLMPLIGFSGFSAIKLPAR